ncbi:CRISPR-associated protein Csm7 [Accumulibacter sp.]|uniref:type III-A CRISPR-associated RAMP protein Csm4 n=1 Tax=Accumulibacter sp. TaxID=2053492 RepID=UPI0025E2A2A9|nr:CRISPR-associated protein Csm7 [Accumulibacter sp.]MCM8626799.1 CRISPR-associated protein Csm7 [Accumulibacter sp.]
MKTSRFTLQPRSAFGTPLAGDTLFGQLCWTLRRQLGNERLNRLLEGYVAGNPFAVVSDALPFGYLPLPTLPSSYWSTATDGAVPDRKALKKKCWLRIDDLGRPLADWQRLAHSEAEAAQTIVGEKSSAPTERAQPHNTINRQTGTTGTGAFAPYTQAQQWFHPGMRFHVYVVFDAARLTAGELQAALTAIGEAGYGRDASIGLGKFSLSAEVEEEPLAALHDRQANAWLALGPVAPQGLGYSPLQSHYQPLTRFGRHGDVAVHSGNPFKRPVLLARGGSVFAPERPTAFHEAWIGQGLSGVSDVLPETVHQGYAPAVGIRLPTTGNC